MTRTLSKIFISGLILLGGTTVSAQKGVEDGSKFGHGEDSIRCLQNLSLFTEYVKQKNYRDAIPAWEIAYNECPLANTKIYTDGIKIMEWRIKNEKDKAKKDELFQMLMGVYDKRIKYMKSTKYNENYILGRKAVNMLEYKKMDPEYRKQAQELLEKSINGQGVKSELLVLINCMTNAAAMYTKGEVQGEDVVNYYLKVADILDKQYAATTKESSKKTIADVKENVEKLFAGTGAADCKIVEEIFAPKFAENKTNKDWLKMVNRLLAQENCEDAQLLYDVSESLHEMEPTAASAYGIARGYLKQNDIAKALEYYAEAITLEEDPKQKATYNYQVGLLMQSQNKIADARSYARKAIELRPDWGDPYLMIGNLYAVSAKDFGKDEFEHKTAYWAAVDMFIKAKSVDAACTDKANELINLYVQYFPTNEEIFFQGLKEGDSYSLGGWIASSTKIRAKK